MHRIRLLAVLAFAALLLAVPARPASLSAVVVSQVYAGGGNTGASFDARLRRALQPRRRPPPTSTAGASSTRPRPATTWQTTLLAGQIPPGQLLPRPAGLGRVDRRRAAGARRDRHHQPGRLRRQGRPRHATASRSPAARPRQLLGRRHRRGPRRLRLGERLRGLGGGRRARELDRGRARRRRLHRHRLEPRRLLGRARRRRATPRRRPSTCCGTRRRREPRGRRASTSTSSRCSRSRSSVRRSASGQAVLRRHAGADLRARHGRQQQRRRLRADRASLRVRAGRPAARHREHRSPRRNLGPRSPAAPGPRSRSLRRRPARSARPRRAAAAGGDVWPTTLGFTAPLPSVAPGHYTSTVTYTVIGR